MTPSWVILWPQWLSDLDRAVDYAQDAVREAAAGLIAGLDGEWEASAARSAAQRSVGPDVRPYLRAARTDPHGGPQVASRWAGVHDLDRAGRREAYEALIGSWERQG